jgi:hypothetical protein
MPIRSLISVLASTVNKNTGEDNVGEALSQHSKIIRATSLRDPMHFRTASICPHRRILAQRQHSRRIDA